jgi:hypothetical protein
MSESTDFTPQPNVPPHSDEKDEHPRADWADGLGWMGLGIAILIGSITMDRLERQGVNPYTVPGLLPGLLGIAMILLGGILALRSWRRGALCHPAGPAAIDEREQRRRIWIVTGLCLGYGVVLIGHGVPFWLASTIYVTGSILILQHMSRDPVERRLTPRVWIKALVIGLSASVITHLVFQELFLVRMP